MVGSTRVGLNGDWRCGSDLWDTELQGLCQGADLLCVADVLSDGWARGDDEESGVAGIGISDRVRDAVKGRKG